MQVLRNTILKPINWLFSCVFIFLLFGIAEPLRMLLIKSVTSSTGKFIGLSNFRDYFSDTNLVIALKNSIFVSLMVTLTVLIIAFILAYGIIRTNFKGKQIVQAIIQAPLFVPSIFPCLGLIYLLGGQGIITAYLDDFELYGFIGVFLGGVIFTLPHAVLLLVTTLRGIDNKLYHAASTLGAGSLRQFISITLANAQYGLLSTGFVVFTLSMTDFGVAKILGGQYPLLATEIYKQVIGQQNFSMGATISLILIVPTAIAFIVDSWARKKQARLANNQFQISITSALYRDSLFTIFGWLITFLLVVILGIVIFGSFVTYWPYDLELTLDNYDFSSFGYGWQPYWNSLILASSVACAGIIIIFISSYISVRCNINPVINGLFRILALLPLSVPGTVLGLAYIFAFNRPESLLFGLRDTFVLLIFNTIIHLFSVSYLTCQARLSQLDKNYENIGRSLSVPSYITFFNIIIPLSILTILDVFFYLFVNSLTTISAVVFLYGPDTLLASITILNMDDAGALSSAAAMGTLLLLTSIAAKFIHIGLNKYYSK